MSSYTFKDYQAVYRKSSVGEGILNKALYRIVSLPFVRLGVLLRATPNQVTYISFLLSLTAALFFLQGDYRLALIGLIPLHLGKILDCADGQLALLTNQKTRLGALLDPLLDRITDIMLLAALSYWAVVQTDSYAAVWLLVAFLAVWFMSEHLSRAARLSTTDALKKVSTRAPLKLLLFIRWDGGFSALIFTLAIIFSQIPLLIGLHLAVVGFATVAQLVSAFRVVRDEPA